MDLLMFRHLWGITEPWETLFPKIHSLGYDGIEHILPDASERKNFRDLLDTHRFFYIAQIVTSGNVVAEHVQSFRRAVDDAAELRPLKINCHSGCDWFSEEESRRYFGEVLGIEAKIGIPIAHETHRGRIFYNPWITERLLKAYPQLNLSCDFSHWVVVAERILEREIGIIEECARHCIHVHARVGYEEGPQVSDPRAPEYRLHVEAHEKWWNIIWDAQEAKGVKQSTMTPEFGAPEYLHTLPFSREPVANLWDICNWQADRQRQRFAERGT